MDSTVYYWFRSMFFRLSGGAISPALLLALCVLFMVLTLPPFDWSLIGFLIFLPLLELWRRCSGYTIPFCGVLFGIMHSSYMYWGVLAYSQIVYVAIVAWIACCAAIFFVLARMAYRKFSRLAPMLIALLWVLFEHSIRMVGIPYSLGALFAESFWLLPSAQWGGVFLLTFLLVAPQIYLYQIWRQPHLRRSALTGFAVSLLVLLLGNFIDTMDSTKSTPVSVVQTAHHPFQYIKMAAENMLALSIADVQDLQAHVAADSELIIWPELSTLGYELRHNRSSKELHAQTHLISAPDLNPEGIRTHSIYAMAPDHAITKLGGKHKLIPWIEASYSKDPQKLPATQIPISPVILICYESTFSTDLARAVKEGGRSIVVQTSDAYAGPSLLGGLHFRFSVLLAVENHRYVVRAANGGVSAFIDERGRVLEKKKFFERGVINAVVREFESYTLYSRYAAWWQWLFVVAGMLGALIVLCRRDNTSDHAHADESNMVSLSAICGVGVLVVSLIGFQIKYVSNQFDAQFENNISTLKRYENNTQKRFNTWFGYSPFFRNVFTEDQFSYEHLRAGNKNESLPLSVSYILLSYGVVAEPMKLLAAYGPSNENSLETSFDRLQAMVEQQYGYDLVFKDMQHDELTLPLVVLMNNDEATVLQSVETSTVTLFSPVNGLIELDRPEFQRKLKTREAVFVAPPLRQWD